MQARIKWNEQVSFIAESESGHAIVIDGSPEHGGRNLGIRPMEAVLMGLGSCSAFDVVQILKKSRQDISDCIVELDAQRADSIPAVFTKIHMTFVLQGRDLKPKSVARAVELSVDKFCSAAAMLRPGVEIQHDWRIDEAPVKTE
jgi:putative redox protein